MMLAKKLNFFSPTVEVNKVEFDCERKTPKSASVQLQIQSKRYCFDNDTTENILLPILSILQNK